MIFDLSAMTITITELAEPSYPASERSRWVERILRLSMSQGG